MSERGWIDSATILRCEVGSGVHGIAQEGKDDRDEMAVCLEPYPLALGIRETFEHHIHRTAAIREGRHDAPSQPGDLDLTVYSLRKWVRLALKGNPTVLLLLFSPGVVKIDPRGEELRRHAHWFVSAALAGPFLGYMSAQRQRLMGERGQKNVNRRELVALHGFDTKYASHIIRLGYQGIELLVTGELTLPMRQDQRGRCLAIRRGEVPLADVLAEARALEADLEQLRYSTSLPRKPNVEAAEAWMLRVYMDEWQETEDVRRAALASAPSLEAAYADPASPQ